MIRMLAAALRFEVRTVLRTREVYTTALVPAVLFVPLLMVWIIMVLSITSPRSGRTLALPHEAPLVLPLEVPDELEVDLLTVDDPQQAVLDGLADAAVLRWWVDDTPGAPWLNADAVARDTVAAAYAEQFVQHVAYQALDQRIEAAGGRAPRDRVLATVARSPVAPDLSALDLFPLASLRRGALLTWVVVVVSLSVLVLPLRTAADRLDGVLEAWAVTSGGAGPLLIVRVFSTSLLFVLVSLLLPSALYRVIPILPVVLGWGDVAEGVLAVLVANSLLVVAGLVATSTRSANQLAGITVTLLGTGTGLGLLTTAVPWLPMAGFGLAEHQGVRLVLTAFALCGVLAVLPWIAQGPRALPAGGRDD